MASPAAVLDILLTANTAPATASLAKTQAQLKATGATATTTSKVMKRAFLGIGLAAGAAGVALFKVGEEFDDAFDKISTRTGATGREMRKLKDVFRGVVADVPASFDEAATAVGDLNTRLGLSGKPLAKMSKQVTELSRITGTDVESNVRAVSRAFVDWEVAVKDQSKTLDGFFRLSQKSGIAVSDIAESVQQFGSPLRQLGFSLDEAAAMFASFEKAGVNTSTMVPGLKLALASLNAPTTDLAKHMKELGIEAGKPEAGLQKVFGLLSGDSISKVEKITLAMEVFGKRAGADMKEAIEQGRFELENFMKVMGEGDTIREAGKRTMDLSEQWTLFKNNLKLAVEPVATKFFQGLGDLMKDVTKAFKKEGLQGVIDLLLNKLGEAIPKVAEMGAKLAGAIFKGLIQAPIWTKLAAAAWIVKAMGGFTKLKEVGAGVGKWIGRGLGVGIIAGLLLMDEDIQKKVREVLTKLKETVTGELLDSSSREEFAHGLTEWFGGAVDGADLTFKGRKKVQVATEFGKLVFNSDTQKLVSVSNNKLKDLVGKGIQDVVTLINSPRYQRMFKPIADAAHTIEHPVKESIDEVDKALKGGADSWDRNTKKVSGSVDGLRKNIGRGFAAIVKMTNNALTAFGAKTVAFDLAGAVAQGASQGKQKGGLIVGGTGTGDKVPAMLEPGEVVLNRKAVAAMGGAGKANAINAMIPRFATGGVIQQALGPYSIPPIQYDPNHAGGNSHLHLDFFEAAQTIAFGKKMQQMGWSVGEYSGSYPGFGPITTHHESPGHYDGTAFDANTAADETRSEVAAVAKLLGGAGGVAAVAEKIARAILKGPDGPLKSMGQAALDKVRNAANSYIAKQQPKVTGGASDFDPAGGGGVLSRNDMRGLLGKVGLPDIFGYIAEAESGLDPNARNPSGASGLWQIMMPLHAALVEQAGGNVFDPLTNAKVASTLSGGGSNLAPWVASQGVWGSHVGQAYQKGGIAGQSYTPGIGSLFSQLGSRKGRRRRKALGSILDQVKAVGLNPETFKRLNELTNAAATFDEYANNASALNSTDADGNTILGLFQGLSEAEWLGGKDGSPGELHKLFNLRNVLIMAEAQVADRMKVIGEMADKARKHFGKVADGVRKLEKELRDNEAEQEANAKNQEQVLKNIDQAKKVIDAEKAKKPKNQNHDLIKAQLAKIAGYEDKLKGLKNHGANLKAHHGQIAAELLRGTRERDLLKGKVLPEISTKQKDLISLRGEILGTGGDGFDGLESVQGRGGPMGVLGSLPGLGVLGGSIFDVQNRLAQLGLAPTVTSTETLTETPTETTTDNTAEQLALLTELLRQTQQRLNVSQAQYGVFANSADLGFAGMFAAGGMIPSGRWGIAGEAGPEVVTGPAQVYSASDSAGILGTDVRVVIQDQRTRVFVNDQEVRAIVKDETRKQARGGPRAGARGY